MSNVQFNEKHKQVLDTFLLKNPVVTPGKMYGHPAYYVGGKLFASLYMKGVCVKVPETLKEEFLKKKGIVPFTPMGRKMREWVLINRENSEEYLNDKEIFDASIAYVASIAGIKLKKD
jgi:TfoX/Sxy family transcriptional regulator of competence genes